MSNVKLYVLVPALLVALFACAPEQQQLVISLDNQLAMARQHETVELSLEDLRSLKPGLSPDSIVLAYRATGALLPFQSIDINDDNASDIIVFQPEIPANGGIEILIEDRQQSIEVPTPEFSTFSRFVPERIDDYAWENDRVAFRTYGPEAQRLTEAGDPGGTLSSGIDCWLKRVPYPIINKWYKKAADGTGSYHEDTGEGLDNYHVGPSRGCGGTGIWSDQTLLTSGNFVSWNRNAVGPLRTSFQLTYGPWTALERQINETKHIALDLGSNLSRIELHLDSDPPVEEVTIGIAIHDKRGQSGMSEEEGWYNYWQPHDGAHLGTAVVIDPSTVTGHTEYLVEEKDKSHLFIHAKPEDGKLVYYTGFFWDKTGQFSGNAAWEQYLSDFSKRIASPIDVKMYLE